MVDFIQKPALLKLLPSPKHPQVSRLELEVEQLLNSFIRDTEVKLFQPSKKVLDNVLGEIYR